MDEWKTMPVLHLISYVFFQTRYPLDSGINGPEIFLENQSLNRIINLKPPQVAHMSLCPVTATCIAQTIAQQERKEPLSVSHGIIDCIRAGTTQITQDFICLIGNMYRRQIPGTMSTGQLARHEGENR